MYELEEELRIELITCSMVENNYLDVNLIPGLNFMGAHRCPRAPFFFFFSGESIKFITIERDCHHQES